MAGRGIRAPSPLAPRHGRVTDDLSRLDALVEREASPNRPRRAPEAPRPEPERFAAGTSQPEWTRAFMDLVERLVDRIVRVEEALLYVETKLGGLDNSLVKALQPLLVRREDDMLRLQGAIAAVADDLSLLRRDLRERLDPLDEPRAEHAPAHLRRQRAAVLPSAPAIETDLPFIEPHHGESSVAAPTGGVTDVGEGTADNPEAELAASVYHLPPDYFEQQHGSAG